MRKLIYLIAAAALTLAVQLVPARTEAAECWWICCPDFSACVRCCVDGPSCPDPTCPID